MQNSLEFIRFELFSTYRNLQHGVCKRSGGNSKGSYKSLNLSFNSGDNPESVILNRQRLASALGIKNSNLLFPDQCHTNYVVCVHSSEVQITNTDALITNRKGIALCVLAADCVPILYFDKKNNVIAAAHAGWRGTVKNINLNVLRTMKAKYNSKYEDILVGIGPCIQQQNYEVGEEVLLEIEKLGSEVYNKFTQVSPNLGHAYIDLMGINKHLLLEEGVLEKNIEVMNLCTYSNSAMFFSARRDGFKSGRFGSVIMLK